MGVNPEGADGLSGYPNLGDLIGTIVSSGRATLYELQTVYGTEDAYDLIEVVIIDAHNQRVLSDGGAS